MKPTWEWWPDYGDGGPVWDERGRPVDLQHLGLDVALISRIRVWHATYEERHLPIEGNSDSPWLREGIGLLAEFRAAVAGRAHVIVTEPWWDEPPE